MFRLTAHRLFFWDGRICVCVIRAGRLATLPAASRFASRTIALLQCVVMYLVVFFAYGLEPSKVATCDVRVLACTMAVSN